MSDEIIEGSAVEIPPPEVRSLVVRQQPGQVVVSDNADPAAMVAVASKLATVLSDIVEHQKLYSLIRGKKFPLVEAWMTIARLDNVVAREPAAPIRHEDGSYEAFAEIVRLSDGMVIGASSALCGTKDDPPWHARSEPARRAMAQTRATSRAFRQQYSWIMALAGYEPTPAEEMPRDDAGDAAEGTGERTGEREHPVLGQSAPTPESGLIGPIDIRQEWLGDLALRNTPEGPVIGFRLKQGRQSIKVLARDALAKQLGDLAATPNTSLAGVIVTCWGTLVGQEFTPKGTTRDVPYQVLHLSKIHGPTFDFMAGEAEPEASGPPDGPGELTEQESEALWAEMDRIGA